MIKIKGNQKRNIEMDLVPLINIVFLLLIFFMLTSSSISGVLQAELPEALSASKVPGKNIVPTSPTLALLSFPIQNMGSVSLIKSR